MATETAGTRVGRFVAAALGRSVGRVERIAGSVANQDFVVELGGDSRIAPDVRARVVVKIGPAAELAAEAWACRRLAGSGLPVPEVVHVDLVGAELGGPALVLGWVAGAPSEEPDVARAAGRVLRAVHATEPAGWGSLVVAGEAAHGEHDTWGDVILADLDGVDELVGVGILDRTLADAARRQVAVDDLLGYRGPGVLLHRDLKPAHLFGLGGRLSAVIDWGDAAVGDPDVDLARLSMAGPVITSAFLDGYGTPLTRSLEEKLARYRIAWNLRALSYEHRAGGTWFAAYRDRVERDVALLAP